MSFDEVKGTNVGNSKPVKHSGSSGANKQKTTGKETVKMTTGSNTSTDKGVSVEGANRVLFLPSGRQIIVGSDGKYTYKSSDGTTLKPEYFEEKEGKVVIQPSGRYTVTKNGKRSCFASNGDKITNAYYREQEEKHIMFQSSDGKTYDLNTALEKRNAAVTQDLERAENGNGRFAKAVSWTKNGILSVAQKIAGFIGGERTQNFYKSIKDKLDTSDEVRERKEIEEKLIKEFNSNPDSKRRAEIFKQLTGAEYNQKNFEAFRVRKIKLESEKLCNTYKESQEGWKQWGKEFIQGMPAGAVAGFFTAITMGLGALAAPELEALSTYVTQFVAKVGPKVLPFLATLGLGSLCSCTPEDDYVSSTNANANANANTTWNDYDTASYVTGYLNKNGDKNGNTTPDGVGYEYYCNIDGQKVISGIKVGGSLSLDFDENITTGNVVDYINQLGDYLRTDDGFDYGYSKNGNNAIVTFTNDDGDKFTHQVGKDMTVTGVTKDFYELLNSVGLGPKDGQILTKLDMPEGSFGNGAKGLGIQLLTTDLDEVASGNMKVKFSIAGQEVSGTVTKDGNDIKIGNAVITPVKDYEIGTPDDPEKVSGFVVTIGNDKYIVTNEYGQLDIGKVDTVGGTTLQYYSHSTSEFDTSNATDADNYFNDKQGNLQGTKTDAKDEYEKYLKNTAGASTHTGSSASVK